MIRKRRSRQARRMAREAGEEAPGAQEGMLGPGGHAPGESSKDRESKEKFAHFWDRVSDLSRAAWEREMRRIARQMWRELGQPSARAG